MPYYELRDKGKQFTSLLDTRYGPIQPCEPIELGVFRRPKSRDSEWKTDPVLASWVRHIGTTCNALSDAENWAVENVSALSELADRRGEPPVVRWTTRLALKLAETTGLAVEGFVSARVVCDGDYDSYSPDCRWNPDADKALKELLEMIDAVYFVLHGKSPNLMKPLNSKQQAALDLIRAEGPITGDVLARRIKVDPGHLRARIIPTLTPYGVANRRNQDGYFISPPASE